MRDLSQMNKQLLIAKLRSGKSTEIVSNAKSFASDSHVPQSVCELSFPDEKRHTVII